MGENAGCVKKYRYRRSRQEKRAEKSRGGEGHQARILMSGGRRRLRREGYGISSTMGSKLSDSSKSGSSTSSSTEGWFSVSPLEGASGVEPISIAFSLGSELKTSSSSFMPSPIIPFPSLIGIEVFFLDRGRLLLTRIPITCPKALTPLSVLPHLLYSVPSQLTSPGANGCVSFG